MKFGSCSSRPLPVSSAADFLFASEGHRPGSFVHRHVQGRSEDRSQPLRPVCGEPRTWTLRGHLGWTGFLHPEYARDPQRRRDCAAALKVPNVRWPGGCFADEYHWRNGIGPAAQRPATINAAWGDVVDTNGFGTHEFMDFMQQIGSQAYVSVNVGSGTPREAADWLEYMTAAQPTALAKERAANGHPDPYEVGFLGIGNESWGCGGNMTADYYLSQLKIYSHFVRNDNPGQQGANHMLKIAVGPGIAETTWTETIMKAWQGHDWSWNIDGLSLHWYTVPNGWPPSTPSTGFGIEDYAKALKSTLFMDEFLRKQETVMDKYDPQKKVALVVDEWGAWHAALPGTNPHFLVQQNSLRDAILAISEPEHLRPPRGPRAHGQHRPDDQCAAVDDPHRQGENGSYSHLLRLQDVCSFPGRDVSSRRL